MHPSFFLLRTLGCEGSLGRCWFPSQVPPGVPPAPPKTGGTQKNLRERKKHLVYFHRAVLHIQEVPETHLWLQLLSFISSNKTKGIIIPFSRGKIILREIFKGTSREKKLNKILKARKEVLHKSNKITLLQPLHGETLALIFCEATCSEIHLIQKKPCQLLK